jgi:hypothetical protein
MGRMALVDCEELAKNVKKELKKENDYLWNLTEETQRERGYQVCMTEKNKLYPAMLFIGDETNVVMEKARFDERGNETINFFGLMQPECNGDDPFLTNVHTHPGKRFPEKTVKTQLSGTDVFVALRGGTDSICVITEGDRLDCVTGLRRMKGETGNDDRDVSWFENVMQFENYYKYNASDDEVLSLAKKKGAHYCKIKL